MTYSASLGSRAKIPTRGGPESRSSIPPSRGSSSSAILFAQARQESSLSYIACTRNIGCPSIDLETHALMQPSVRPRRACRASSIRMSLASVPRRAEQTTVSSQYFSLFDFTINTFLVAYNVIDLYLIINGKSHHPQELSLRMENALVGDTKPPNVGHR